MKKMKKKMNAKQEEKQFVVYQKQSLQGKVLTNFNEKQNNRNIINK